MNRKWVLVSLLVVLFLSAMESTRWRRASMPVFTGVFAVMALTLLLSFRMPAVSREELFGD